MDSNLGSLAALKPSPEIHRHGEVKDEYRDGNRLLDSMAAPVAVFATDGCLLYINPACECASGYTFEEVKGQLFWDKLVDPLEEQNIRAAFAVLVAGETPAKRENHWITKSGERHLFAWSDSMAVDENNEPRYIVSTGVDVTAYSQAQQTLRENEESLTITLDSIGDGVIATNRQGQIIRMNRVAQKLTGWTFAEAQGRKLMEVFRVVSSEGDTPLADPCDSAMRTGVAVNLAPNTALLSRDGRRYLIADSAALIQNRSSTSHWGLVLVFRDVTEKSAMELAFQQAKKLEMIGRLAGGVAHDFNNILAGIIGYGEMLVMNLAADTSLQGYARSILEAAERAARLTSQLLAFSRKGKLISRPIDIHTCIISAVGLLERTMDKCISVVTRLNALSSSVMGDPTLLEAAILNLGINARDAISLGGRISIGTRNVRVDQDFLSGNSVDIDPGEYVEISLSDTGMGMTQEVKDHLYEPFYTTKDIGQGTGLGLAAVYGTVKEHHGAILVASEPDQGTSFRIYLPLCEMPEAEVSDVEVQDFTGSGCILLVDDEKVVRETTSAMLQEVGYEVLVAPDGATALDFYRREGRRIQLVILDVVMPRMNGPDTFFALRDINPEIKVILSSGYSFETGAKELLDKGVFGFIQKPFRRNALYKVIKETIISKRQAAS